MHRGPAQRCSGRLLHRGPAARVRIAQSPAAERMLTGRSIAGRRTRRKPGPRHGDGRPAPHPPPPAHGMLCAGPRGATSASAAVNVRTQEAIEATSASAGTLLRRSRVPRRVALGGTQRDVRAPTPARPGIHEARWAADEGREEALIVP